MDELGHEEYMLDRLAAQVGGHDALDRLDAAPLPDKPFCWSRIAADIRTEMGEVLSLIDGCCELLDVEYRTISRRSLAQAAAGDPEVFRRGVRPDYMAAAVVWKEGKATTCSGRSR